MESWKRVNMKELMSLLKGSCMMYVVITLN